MEIMDRYLVLKTLQENISEGQNVFEMVFHHNLQVRADRLCLYKKRAELKATISVLIKSKHRTIDEIMTKLNK